MACCIVTGIFISVVARRIPLLRHLWKKNLVQQDRAVQWSLQARDTP